MLVPALLVLYPIHNDLLVNHYGLDKERVRLVLTLGWVNGVQGWQLSLEYSRLYCSKLVHDPTDPAFNTALQAEAGSRLTGSVQFGG